MLTIDETMAPERTDLLPGSYQQSDKIRIKWKRVVSHCIWFLLADCKAPLPLARSEIITELGAFYQVSP